MAKLNEIKIRYPQHKTRIDTHSPTPNFRQDLVPAEEKITPSDTHETYKRNSLLDASHDLILSKVKNKRLDSKPQQPTRPLAAPSVVNTASFVHQLQDATSPNNIDSYDQVSKSVDTPMVQKNVFLAKSTKDDTSNTFVSKNHPASDSIKNTSASTLWQEQTSLLLSFILSEVKKLQHPPPSSDHRKYL